MKTVRIGEQALRIGVWTIIAILIVGGGVVGCQLLMKHGPKTPKVAPVVQLPTVEIEIAELKTVEIHLPTQGDVIPRQRTTLTAEVGGALIEINPAFEAGETFKQGDRLLQIDRSDYQAALTNAQSALSDAKLAVEMELARKSQSLRDWEKLGRGGEPSDLVKRIPQMASARARETSAESAVDKALRDLERTEIKAPYDCRIEQTYVDTGAIVAPGMQLADVVSLGAVEIRLALSMEDFGYLKRDESGRVTGEVKANAMIGGERMEWTGRLVRSDEFVDRDLRSVHVVAEFGGEGGGAPPIGMFVKATIVGKSLPDVFEVNRAALIDAENREKQVIILTEDNRLKITTVAVKRSEAEVSLISVGLQAGDRIVVTPLSAPVNGLEVEVAEPDREEKAAEEVTPVPTDKPS